MTKFWFPLTQNGSNEVKHVGGECMYMNGKLHGDVKVYFNNRNIPYQHTKFKNGIKHGCELQYHINGKLSTSTYYINDKPSGEWKSWYWSGNLWIEANFDDDGNKHGVYHEYYDRTINGKKREYYFNHGKECGTFKAWYKPNINDTTDTKLPLYEYTFNDNNNYCYKEWNKDETVKYDFVYHGDKNTIPKPFRRMKFSTDPSVSSTTTLVKYCFRR